MAYKPKRSNSAYKMGKLSRNARFSPKAANRTLLAVLACVLFTFIFAVILGNILGDRAASSKNTVTDSGGTPSILVPTPDKVSPHESLNAYFADMTGADPNVSLSEQTAAAREMGNALYIELCATDGSLIYSSEKASELGYPSAENLTLDRLGNHFAYYNDFAVGLFHTEFSAELALDQRSRLQANDCILLNEAAETAFDQLMIEFSGEITKDTVIYYQSYLLNLKLACEGTAIGIKLPLSFVTDTDNTGMIADLLEIADFCAIDLEARSADEIRAALSPLVYFTERYNGVILLSSSDGLTLSERIQALTDKGIKSYIIK